MLYGSMTLAAFFETFAVGKSSFREDVDLSKSQLNRLEHGAAPSAKVARRIFVATGGHVDANRMLGLDAAEVQAAARQVRATLRPPATLLEPEPEPGRGRDGGQDG